MADKRKSTGLGTDAFFRTPPVSTGAAGRPAIEEVEEVRPAATAEKKVRTTVMLYPQTLAALDMLKVRARRGGEKATYSDILEEAIRELAKVKGVEV